MKLIAQEMIDWYPPGTDVTDVYDVETAARLVAEGYLSDVAPAGDVAPEAPEPVVTPEAPAADAEPEIVAEAPQEGGDNADSSD